MNKKNFFYSDNSNNIFTKIKLVNALTQKEIDILNDKYKKLGLYIKQVNVDNFGNEIFNNKSLLNNNNNLIRPKRHTHPSMTLKEFYKKYYYNNYISQKNKKKKVLKLQKNKKKKIFEEKEKNIEKKSESSEYNESMDINEKYDEEDLKPLRKNLLEIFDECQKLQYKDCKIKDESFKLKIIEYIIKFKNYLSNKQYLFLFNKWKNELMKIKGVNPLDYGAINDLLYWKIPILKAFKSEIVLLAMSNVLGKKIGVEDDGIGYEEEDNEDKKMKEDKKENENDESNSDSSKEYDDDFENEQAQILQLKRNANNEEEE